MGNGKGSEKTGTWEEEEGEEKEDEEEEDTVEEGEEEDEESGGEKAGEREEGVRGTVDVERAVKEERYAGNVEEEDDAEEEDEEEGEGEDIMEVERALLDAEATVETEIFEGLENDALADSSLSCRVADEVVAVADTGDDIVSLVV